MYLLARMLFSTSLYKSGKSAWQGDGPKKGLSVMMRDDIMKEKTTEGSCYVYLI